MILSLARVRVRFAALFTRNFCFSTQPEYTVNAMGLKFTHPVGVAAGFDRKGTLIAPLTRLGFGFVEVGTVTPQPEPGHNPGIAVVVTHLARTPATAIVGVSIGANSRTAPVRVVDDYVYCLRQAWNQAGYIVLNLSSPRLALAKEAPRDLLQGLLERIKAEQSRLTGETGRSVPIAVKITFDTPLKEIPDALRIAKALSFDGVIAAVHCQDATNHSVEQMIGDLAGYLEGLMPIISVGGVRSAADVQARLAAGAALVQVFSGLLHCRILKVANTACRF